MKAIYNGVVVFSTRRRKEFLFILARIKLFNLYIDPLIEYFAISMKR